MSFDLSSPDTENLFLKWTKGNKDASRLLVQFAHWARLVDDMVDEDINDVQTHISRILELSLIYIPGNSFFLQHQQAIQAVIMEMVIYWKLGDQFRKSENEKTQMFGFVHRESTDRLVAVVASLCGGMEWGEKCVRELHELTHAQSPETLADWLAEETNNGTLRKRAKGS